MAAHGCRFVAAASLALIAACCAGCVHDIFGSKDAAQAVPPGKVRHATAPKVPDASTTTDWSSLLPGLTLPGAKQEPPPGALRGEQVAEVIEGLQALDRLDPQSRAAIQASLDRTHPTNWPYVFRFHREALGGAKGLAAGAPWGASPPTPAVPWGFPPKEAANCPGRTAFGQPPGPAQAGAMPGNGTQRSAAPGSATQSSATQSSATQSSATQGSATQGSAMQAGRLLSSRPQPAKEPPQAKTSSPQRQPGGPEIADRPGPADARESSLERYLRMAGFRAETAAASANEDAWPEGQWEGHLQKAIKSLESQAQAGDDPYGQALLRVLYAVAGRRDDALRPIPAVAEAEREFWVNEMRGLTEYLDNTQTASPDRRAAEAARWFRDAAGRLAELGALDVRNLAFCTAVHSFGSLDRFPKNEFQPGDEVLLYAEIENFASESTKAGHRTALKARFEIFQGAGRVHEQDLPPAEETCERKRRDFFLSYRLRLPAGLKPGEYTLQLTIDDTLGRKTATRSIGLRIR